MPTVRFISSLTPCTGNCVTIKRISSYFKHKGWECSITDASRIDNETATFDGVDVVVAVHAYRSGRLMPNQSHRAQSMHVAYDDLGGNTLARTAGTVAAVGGRAGAAVAAASRSPPWVLVLGGTDVNEYLKPSTDESRRLACIRALDNAARVVAFSSGMLDALRSALLRESVAGCYLARLKEEKESAGPQERWSHAGLSIVGLVKGHESAQEHASSGATRRSRPVAGSSPSGGISDGLEALAARVLTKAVTIPQAVDVSCLGSGPSMEKASAGSTDSGAGDSEPSSRSDRDFPDASRRTPSTESGPMVALAAIPTLGAYGHVSLRSLLRLNPLRIDAESCCSPSASVPTTDGERAIGLSGDSVTGRRYDSDCKDGTYPPARAGHAHARTISVSRAPIVCLLPAGIRPVKDPGFLLDAVRRHNAMVAGREHVKGASSIAMGGGTAADSALGSTSSVSGKAAAAGVGSTEATAEADYGASGTARPIVLVMAGPRLDRDFADGLAERCDWVVEDICELLRAPEQLTVSGGATGDLDPLPASDRNPVAESTVSGGATGDLDPLPASDRNPVVESGNEDIKTTGALAMGYGKGVEAIADGLTGFAKHGGTVLLPPVPRPTLLRWMLEADVVVNSSISEGMPNALLEAAALGVPVVARRIPGNCKVVRNGQTGLLFDAADEAVGHITRIAGYAELRSRMGSAGKTMVAEQFSRERERAAWQSLMDDVMPRSGPKLFDGN